MINYIDEYDVVIIGGGPAGMSAAISIKNKGVEKVLLLERENMLGGALNQCIHCNFGEKIFKHKVTGNEYAEYFIQKLNELNVEVKLNTMVLEIGEEKTISYVNPEDGMNVIKSKAIVFAMGSREKFNGNADIPLNKFTGIYTVGAAHRFINIQGYLPGKEIVILGSTDHDVIVARRLIVEGAKIKAMVESSNYVKCTSERSKKIIEDFDIKIKSGYVLKEVKGKERVARVVISNNNEKIDEVIECDSLLISVEWNSESDLAKKLGIELNKDYEGIIVDKDYRTKINGIFACGNVISCNSLSDKCVNDGEDVGKSILEYLVKEKLV